MAAGCGLFFFHWYQNDFFAGQKIDGKEIFEDVKNSYSLASHSEIKSVLDQPFDYLGHGKQCYVFTSRDNRFVIKFFNFSSNHRPSWLRFVRLPQFLKWEKIWARKERRGRDFFRGYCLDQCVQELFPAMTATLHVGFENSSHRELILYDKKHQKHSIQLDNTAFVLQRKASPFLPWIEESFGTEALFRKRIGAYLDLLLMRADLGIHDPDGRLLDHIGLVDERLVFIDQGRICFEQEIARGSLLKEKMFKETKEMRKFLSKISSEKLHMFEEELAEKLSSRNESTSPEERSLLHRLFDQRSHKTR